LHAWSRKPYRPTADTLSALRPTLLHEIAHAAVDLDRPLRKGADDHGRRFLRELRRLVAAGEECLPASPLLLPVAIREIS